MPQLDFTSLITDRTRDFTGRAWIFAKIDSWLSDQDGERVFLISGDAGIGKTAIAARLVQIDQGMVLPPNGARLGKDCLVYHHFCQSNHDPSLNPIRFVEYLSLHLANRYASFARALLKTNRREIQITQHQTVGEVHSGGEVIGIKISNLTIGDLSPRTAFDELVRKPLEQLQAPDIDSQILILVDSLDEALTFGENNIAKLLADVTRSENPLLPTIRFLLTSRNAPHILAAFGKTTLDLLSDAPPDVDEVQQYVLLRAQQVGEPKRMQLAGRIATESKGNFLYARYVLDDLLKNPDGTPAEKELILPVDLEDIYRKFLERELARNRERWQQVHRPLLGLLVIARGEGLTRDQLVDILHVTRGIRESTTDDALVLCAPYLSASTKDGPFRVYHQSFREFLMNRGDFHVYPEEAHEDIANYYWDTCQSSWSACDRYCLNYLPLHLAAAGQHSRLRHLLADFDWLQAKLAALDVNAVIADYKYLEEDSLQAWKAFLQERVHLLERGNAHWLPNRIFLQLAVEHADNSPITLAEEEWLNQGKCDWIWLRRRSRPALLPAQAYLASVRVGDPIVDMAVDKQGNKAVVLTAHLDSGLTSIDFWTLAHLDLQSLKIVHQNQLPVGQPTPFLAGLLESPGAHHLHIQAQGRVERLAALAIRWVGYHHPELIDIARANNATLLPPDEPVVLLDDGHRIVTGTHDGVLRIWDLNKLELAAGDMKDDPEARYGFEQARQEWSLQQTTDSIQQVYSKHPTLYHQLTFPSLASWEWMNHGLQRIAFLFNSAHQLCLVERDSGRLIASWISDFPLFDPESDNQLLSRWSVRAVRTDDMLAVETAAGTAILLTAIQGSQEKALEILDVDFSKS